MHALCKLLTLQVDGKLRGRITAPSKVVPIIKWVVMILLGLAFLACLTASKIALVYLGALLKEARKKAENHGSTLLGAWDFYLCSLYM